MPRTPVPARRPTALIALLLQFVVAAVVPVADAGLEAAVSDRQVHIEAPGDGPCAPVHDHLTCQLCRVQGRDLVGSTPAESTWETAPPVRVPLLLVAAAPAATTPRSALGPRAPPIR